MNRQVEMQALVEEFAFHQLKQDECISKCDAIAGNKHAKRLLSCFIRLTEWGDAGREALSQLFDHENPSVRCTAASFLLRYKHEEAMKVLKEIAARDELGLVSLGAKCSIKNWQTGDWELDPE